MNVQIYKDFSLWVDIWFWNCNTKNQANDRMTEKGNKKMNKLLDLARELKISWNTKLADTRNNLSPQNNYEKFSIYIEYIGDKKKNW